MAIKTYNDLMVFQETYQLALGVSRTSRSLPRHEQLEIGR
jgi:hypothetical protein